MLAGLNSSYSAELKNIAPAWVNEPNGRGLYSYSYRVYDQAEGFPGTWKIITSCCFTLSLCVITAIHL